MKDLKEKLMQEIIEVTTVIQRQCPELYVTLQETPLFISYDKQDIKIEDYEKYLSFLKKQLQEFMDEKKV
ncbi:MAG: hypothetical protein LBI72_04740 [Flavobacteriaceae bacterium]|jgi:hypothetical protein|nr:hypothetical protein [Flavobacteriaceae bacterium]